MRLYLSSFRNGNKPEELLRLLGTGRRTALIANSMDFLDESARTEGVKQETERLTAIGLEPTEVDLRQYFGKQEELKQVLSSFDLIWARGGNAFILRRAFRQSGADIIIPELLAEDKLAYGGYSAGICILSPSLEGFELVDEPHVIPEGYDSEVLWDCLDIVTYAIAPHYKSDHPESAAINKSVDYLIDHHIPFIALRDGEVIIVEGQERRVVS